MGQNVQHRYQDQRVIQKGRCASGRTVYGFWSLCDKLFAASHPLLYGGALPRRRYGGRSERGFDDPGGGLRLRGIQP